MAMKSFAVALAVSLAFAPAALAEAFKVDVNQTVTLKLTAPADSVVIGNATVADVAVHDPFTLLVTGKAFGTTNLLVLDHAGKTIYSNNVAVAGQPDGQITIVRGPGTYTYSCIDKCRATPTVGDAPSHFAEVMQSVTGLAASGKGAANQ